MKYQFKSSDFKQRFAEQGAIYAEVAEFVGMNQFELGKGVVQYFSCDKLQTMEIPTQAAILMAVTLPNSCFVVEDKEIEETRSQKIERLCYVIAYGQFHARPAPSQLIISPELSLTFTDDRGDITVSALYNGNFCYDIFTEKEQESLYDAFETYKANAVRKEKDDFFMNVKF